MYSLIDVWIVTEQTLVSINTGKLPLVSIHAEISNLIGWNVSTIFRSQDEHIIPCTLTE